MITVGVDEPIRVEHLGTSSLVGLEVFDCDREVGIPENVFLGACGEHERRCVLLVRLDCGREALGRDLDVVDACLPAVVLDRASCESSRRCLLDRRCDFLWVVGEAVLEICARREQRRPREQVSMRDGVVSCGLAIRPLGARGGLRFQFVSIPRIQSWERVVLTSIPVRFDTVRQIRTEGHQPPLRVSRIRVQD